MVEETTMVMWEVQRVDSKRVGSGRRWLVVVWEGQDGRGKSTRRRRSANARGANEEKELTR